MLNRTMTKGEFKAILDGKIPVYDALEKTSHGYFEVIHNGRRGLLNSQYEQVLQPQYIMVEVVNKGIIIAALKRGNYKIYSERGYPITDRIFTLREDAIRYARFF